MKCIYTIKRALFSLALAVFFVPNISFAIDSDCGLGLVSSAGAPPVIDGQAGAEWAAASVINSTTSPCLEHLLDLQGDPDVGPYVFRSVEVRSQRYSRAGTPYVGFLFTIPDSTPCEPTGGTPSAECAGEMLVIHFNPLINGDIALDTAAPDRDRRIELTHFWEVSGAEITGYLSTEPAESSPAFCPPATNPLHNETRFGANDSSSGIDFAIRQGVGNTYVVEIEVPESFINREGAMTLTTDIGVAFGIINDYATAGSFAFPNDPAACSPASPCLAAGTGFPDTLQVVNGFHPTGTCQPGWTEPRNWGVGYLTNPPGTLSITRLPAFWNSNGIRVRECDSLGYTYYPDEPCRVRIEADIVNAGAAATKKIGFFWAKHGTGDPAFYNLVEIRDVVLGSSMTTMVSTDEWDGVPADQPNHPCLRVYILPDNFDESLITPNAMGEISKAQMDNVVGTYSLQDHHWAQKNISRHATITSCPSAGCRIIGAIDSPIQFDISLFPAAFAQQAGPNADSAALFDQFAADADLAALMKENVLVLIRTFATRKLSDDGSPYNFVDDFGGVVQAFPIEMVQQGASLDVEFEMPNAANYAVDVLIDAHIHSPIADLNLELDLGPKVVTLAAGSATTVAGTLVKNEGNGGQCGWPAPFDIFCGMSIMEILIVLIIVFIALLLAIFRKIFKGAH